MRGKRILILGGTTEARELAHLLHDRGTDVVTSLAGVTEDPAPLSGTVRRGGFGGADGLAAYLARENFAALVDATHPFAKQISRHAVEAASKCKVPILRLERPPWQAGRGDKWRYFAGISDAAAALPDGARVLVTVGRRELAPFFSRRAITGIARMIEPPAISVPSGWSIILARPPFTQVDELSLFERERISVLVTKNSGGGDMRPKLDAARERGIAVYVINRPHKPEIATATAPDTALMILAALVRT